MMFDDQYIPKF